MRLCWGFGADKGAAAELQALSIGPRGGGFLKQLFAQLIPESAGSAAGSHVLSFLKHRAPDKGICDLKGSFSSPTNQTRREEQLLPKQICPDATRLKQQSSLLPQQSLRPRCHCLLPPPVPGGSDVVWPRKIAHGEFRRSLEAEIQGSSKRLPGWRRAVMASG